MGIRTAHCYLTLKRLTLCIFGGAVPGSTAAGELVTAIVGTSDYVYHGLSQSQHQPAAIGKIIYSSSYNCFVNLGTAYTGGARATTGAHEDSISLGYEQALQETYEVVIQARQFHTYYASYQETYNYQEYSTFISYLNEITLNVSVSPDRPLELLNIGGEYSSRIISYDLSLNRPISKSIAWHTGMGRAEIWQSPTIHYIYGNIGLSTDYEHFSLELDYVYTSDSARNIGGVSEWLFTFAAHY